jgi:hypothetical protein
VTTFEDPLETVDVAHHAGDAMRLHRRRNPTCQLRPGTGRRREIEVRIVKKVRRVCL